MLTDNRWVRPAMHRCNCNGPWITGDSSHCVCGFAGNGSAVLVMRRRSIWCPSPRGRAEVIPSPLSQAGMPGTPRYDKHTEICYTMHVWPRFVITCCWKESFDTRRQSLDAQENSFSTSSREHIIDALFPSSCLWWWLQMFLCIQSYSLMLVSLCPWISMLRVTWYLPLKTSKKGDFCICSHLSARAASAIQSMPPWAAAVGAMQTPTPPPSPATPQTWLGLETRRLTCRSTGSWDRPISTACRAEAASETRDQPRRLSIRLSRHLGTSRADSSISFLKMSHRSRQMTYIRCIWWRHSDGPMWSF